MISQIFLLVAHFFIWETWAQGALWHEISPRLD
jgi:hypothetical protein